MTSPDPLSSPSQCGPGQTRYNSLSEIPLESGFNPPIDQQGYVSLENEFSFSDPRLAPFNPDTDIAFSLDILGISIDEGDPSSIIQAQCDLYASFGLSYNMEIAYTLPSGYEDLSIIYPEILQGAGGRYYAIYRDYHNRMCTLPRDYALPQPGTALDGNGGRGVVPMPLGTLMTLDDYRSFVSNEAIPLHPSQICIDRIDPYTNSDEPLVSFALDPRAEFPSNNTTELTGIYAWDRPNLFNQATTLQLLNEGLSQGGLDNPFSILPEYDPATQGTTFSTSATHQRPIDITRDMVNQIYITYGQTSDGQLTPQFQFLTPEAAGRLQEGGTSGDAIPISLSISNNPSGRQLYAQILQYAATQGIDFVARSQGRTRTVTNPLTGNTEEVTSYTLYAVRQDVALDYCREDQSQSGMFAIDLNRSYLTRSAESNGSEGVPLPQENIEAIAQLLVDMSGERGSRACLEQGVLSLPLEHQALSRLRKNLGGNGFFESITSSLTTTDAEAAGHDIYFPELERLIPDQELLTAFIDQTLLNIDSNIPNDTWWARNGDMVIGFGIAVPIGGALVHLAGRGLMRLWQTIRGGRNGPGGGSGGTTSSGGPRGSSTEELPARGTTQAPPATSTPVPETTSPGIIIVPTPAIVLPTGREVRDFGQPLPSPASNAEAEIIDITDGDIISALPLSTADALNMALGESPILVTDPSFTGVGEGPDVSLPALAGTPILAVPLPVLLEAGVLESIGMAPILAGAR